MILLCEYTGNYLEEEALGAVSGYLCRLYAAFDYGTLPASTATEEAALMDLV